MSKIITHDEFVQMVEKNNKYVKIIGTYNGMRNKVYCQCMICGDKYMATAYDVKIGKKHNKCAAKISGENRLKENDTFVKELQNSLPHITLLESYIGSHKKVLCRCNVHNELFKSTPTKLLAGKSGCKKCKSELISTKLKKSHTDFISKLNLITDQIEVIGKYNTSKDTIEVKCKKCGFTWYPTAGSLLAGNGCPHCVGRYKTTEEFRNEIASINDSIDIVGEYINSHTKIKCRCRICGNEWFSIPGNLKYSGCPECNMSHGERSIKHFLDSHSISYVSQKKFPGLIGVNGGDLSYDFYIVESNTLIEYQGEFHDGTAYQQTLEEYEIQKEHDRRKRNYAQKNGYQLIEIWYHDYDIIDEILEMKLC